MCDTMSMASKLVQAAMRSAVNAAVADAAMDAAVAEPTSAKVAAKRAKAPQTAAAARVAATKAAAAKMAAAKAKAESAEADRRQRSAKAKAATAKAAALADAAVAAKMQEDEDLAALAVESSSRLGTPRWPSRSAPSKLWRREAAEEKWARTAALAAAAITERGWQVRRMAVERLTQVHAGAHISSYVAIAQLAMVAHTLGACKQA